MHVLKAILLDLLPQTIREYEKYNVYDDNNAWIDTRLREVVF